MTSGLDKKFLPNYKDCLIAPNATIKEALSAISKSGALLATVVNEHGALVGIFTDGDARRAILGGASVGDSIEPFIKTNPILARGDSEASDLRELAQSEGVREIPLVDALGKLVDVFVVIAHDERISNDGEPASTRKCRPRINSMFLMAGGKGTRLRPVVNDRPKPLALVGNRPIIQTIIENAISCGIRKFYVSVNYKANLIVDHLKADFYSAVSIDCIHETSFLGTAGCLGYLGDQWQEPMVVSNADVLTNIAIDRVLDYHEASGADATCVVRPYHVQVPFGVVDIGPNGITGIREKPTHKHVVNTGIYVLSPKIRGLTPIGEFLDMPTLLQKCLDQGLKVVPYLMHEYWRDVGRPEEYALANEEYYNIFGDRQ